MVGCSFPSGHGASLDQVLNLGRDVEGMGRERSPSCPYSRGQPIVGCRGRGGLWGSALVHPGGLTDRRLYCEANPRGRGRLWGSALVVPGGRSIEDYEESGNTGYDLLAERSRTHALGKNVDRRPLPPAHYGLLISHRGYGPMAFRNPRVAATSPWAKLVAAPP